MISSVRCFFAATDSRAKRAALAGLGAGSFFVTFAAFIGFEATTIYSEEAREPQRTVPRATYISAAKDVVQKVYDTAYEAGVMVRTSGANVIISPPLVITAADVQKIVSALDAGLSAARG